MSFIVRRIRELGQPEQTEFGSSLTIFGTGDFQQASVRYVKIRKGGIHHHTDTTEIYLPVAGRGVLYGDDEQVDLFPGEYVMIPPGTKHRAESPTDDLEMLVISIPGNDPITDYVKGDDTD